MENLGHANVLRFGAIGVVILFSVLIIVTAVIMTPNVDYSNVPNSTVPLFGIRYQIEYSSIPTIINGITASTSIIIGFTGAMVALFYRVFDADDSTKTVLLISAFYEIVPLAFLLFVYIFLPLGFTDGALKLALVALGLSLVSFSNVMLGSFYRLVKRSEKPTTKKGDEKLEWKITIKNGDKELEATGMDGETIQKILESWNKNINPANPEQPQNKDCTTKT